MQDGLDRMSFIYSAAFDALDLNDLGKMALGANQSVIECSE